MVQGAGRARVGRHGAWDGGTARRRWPGTRIRESLVRVHVCIQQWWLRRVSPRVARWAALDPGQRTGASAAAAAAGPATGGRDGRGYKTVMLDCAAWVAVAMAVAVRRRRRHRQWGCWPARRRRALPGSGTAVTDGINRKRVRGAGAQSSEWMMWRGQGRRWRARMREGRRRGQKRAAGGIGSCSRSRRHRCMDGDRSSSRSNGLEARRRGRGRHRELGRSLGGLALDAKSHL